MRATEEMLAPPQPASDRRRIIAKAARLLWQRRYIVCAVPLAFAVGSTIIALLLPPRYQAITRLLPAPSSASSESLSATLRPEASSLAGLVGLNNQGRFLALLHSRVLADRIVDRFGLMKLYGAKYRHEARTTLANRTSIEEDRKTSVISITFTDGDSSRAAQVANAYATELEHLNNDMNNSGAHMERIFIEGRIEEVNKELHEAATRLSQFSTKYSVVDLQQGKSTVDAALLLQGQIMAAQAELKGLEEIYTPYSPKLLSVKAKIAELNRQLGALRGPDAANDIPTKGLLPSIRNLPALGVTFGELYRKSKLLEVEQVALTQQLELSKMEEVKQLPVFRVMDPAEVPEQRISPRRTFIVQASTVAGLLFGIAFVFGGEAWAAVRADDPIKVLVVEATEKILGPHSAEKLRGQGYSRTSRTEFASEEPEKRGTVS